MGYKALYREWRPGDFKEIVGQEHVTRTLQNALNSGRISHAYLFCGTRGTGKTTTAKVLARALNCRDLPGAESCGRCDSCTAIAEGHSMDVAEIDAASNRGIDEIRELREKINLSPSGGGYRVYIIDEVHMLTNEAFNALLKTLEEPPAHVIFILATTEPHRVPMTILSRCQRFDFKPLAEEDMVGRLREVAAGSGLAADDGALKALARAAEGSLRDALSIMDQASSLGDGRIDEEAIHNIMGTVNEEMLRGMTDCILEGNASRAVEMVEELFAAGKDLRVFARQLAGYLRNMIMEDIQAAEAGSSNRDLLLHVTKLLVRYEQDMRWSSQPRLLMELFLLETVYGSGEESPGDMLLRLSRLEEKVEKLLAAGSSVNSKSRAESPGVSSEDAPERDYPGGEAGNNSKPGSKESKERKESIEEGPESVFYRAPEQPAPGVKESPGEGPAEEKETAPAQPEGGDGITLERVQYLWPRILEAVKKESKATRACMESCWPAAVSGHTLTLGYEEEDITRDVMDRDKNKQVLARVLGFFFKGEWSVRCVTGAPPPQDAGEEDDGQGDTGWAMQLFNAEEVKKTLPE